MKKIFLLGWAILVLVACKNNEKEAEKPAIQQDNFRKGIACTGF